jgi:hypothetical protein
MATYNKINDFVEQLCLAKHQCNTDVFKVMLTNTAPVATNTIKSDLTDIAAGNGYVAGGEDAQNTLAEAAGTATCTCTKITWTCVTAPMAAFRYPTIYNDTQASPVKPLIAWWDYASSLILAIGETFSVKFNNSETTGTLFTLA